MMGAAAPAPPTPRGAADEAPAPAPGGLRTAILPAAVALASLGLVAWTQAVALRERYSLRLAGDNFIHYATVRTLALHPGSVRSPLFAGSELGYHTSPYTWLLGLIHRWSGRPDTADALAEELAFVGLAVAALVLAAFFLLGAALAGWRVGLLAAGLLPLAGAPFLIVWAGDLSWHGLAYAGYYPQTMGLALLFLTLAATLRGAKGRARPGWLGAAVGGLALTAWVHGLTGLVAAPLFGAALLQGGRPWREAWPWLAGAGAAMVLVAFLPGDLAETLPALARLPLAALPFLGHGAAKALQAATAKVAPPDLPAAAYLVGALAVLLVAAGPLGQETFGQSRLWAWALLLPLVMAGAPAFRVPLLAAWILGALAAFLAGLAGAPIPVYWRMVFFAAPALCLAAARWLSARPIPWQAAACAALAVLAVGQVLGTAALHDAGSQGPHPYLQVGDILPAGEGTVLTDPHTATFVVAATAHKVATHRVDSVLDGDRGRNDAGFRLLQRVHAEGLTEPVAAELRAQGVELVVVNVDIAIGDSTEYYSYWNRTTAGDFFADQEERAANQRTVGLLREQAEPVGARGAFHVFRV